MEQAALVQPAALVAPRLVLAVLWPGPPKRLSKVLEPSDMAVTFQTRHHAIDSIEQARDRAAHNALQAVCMTSLRTNLMQSRPVLLQHAVLIPPHGHGLYLHTRQYSAFGTAITNLLSHKGSMGTLEIERLNGLPHLVQLRRR